MRLYLLPISTRRVLIYCAHRPEPAAEQSYIDKAVNWTSKTWTAWEQSQTSWKLKTTEYGNKLLRRISYEEWGLKSIPPLTEKRRQQYAQLAKVDVVFPGVYRRLWKDDALDICKRLATERQGLHRQRMYGSVGLMPLTIPFGLLPITYSHWTALRGATHLQHLVDKSLLVAQPSGLLDSLYSLGLLHATREAWTANKDPSAEQSVRIVSAVERQLREGKEPADGQDAKPAEGPAGAAGDAAGPPGANTEPEIMLLRRWNAKLIAERLALPGLEVEIERAVEQVEALLGAESKPEGKGEGTAGTKGSAESKAEGTEGGPGGGVAAPAKGADVGKPK